jgi:hypothetical protein
MVTRRNFRLVAMLDLFVLIARFERSQPSLAARMSIQKIHYGRRTCNTYVYTIN